MSPKTMTKTHHNYHIEHATITKKENRTHAQINQHLTTLEREIANLISTLALKKTKLPELVETINNIVTGKQIGRAHV